MGDLVDGWFDGMGNLVWVGMIVSWISLMVVGITNQWRNSWVNVGSKINIFWSKT